MVTDDATRGSAQNTMMPGKMTGSAAYHGPLYAAFGIGRCRDEIAAIAHAKVLFMFTFIS